MHFRLLTVCIVSLFVPAACTSQDGTLVGAVAPPTGGVRVAAMQEGRPAAHLDINSPDGRFKMNLAPGAYNVSVSAPTSSFPIMFHGVLVEPRTFTELPAGSYAIQVTAPGYAQDAIAVNVSQEETAAPDITLLYVSAIDGVDWVAGKIRVTGVGLPPAGAANATIRREMARRAALADAERKLVKAVAQIKTGPDQSLKSQYDEKSFTKRIQGFIRGYKVTGERELEDGTIEIDAELPLTGPGGLSRYLTE